MVDRKFKRVSLLLVFAIIIGCLYIYPDIRLIYELKGDYRGITMTAANDELLYLGMINAFYKGGNFTLAGFDNYEHHKGQPWAFGFLPEVLLGSIGRLLRIPVAELDILMSFVLPIVLFILIYVLSLKLSGSSGLSLIGSASVLLGYYIFTPRVDSLKNIFSLKYSQPLWFLRPISPQANHIMLILSVLFIYIALASKGSLFLWFSGIALGLLSYTFPYSWAFVYAGLFVIALIFIIKKEFNYIRRITFILLLSSIISIPYLINLWRLVHFPNYDNLSRLINVVYTHKPILPLSQVFLTIFILSSYYKKTHDFSFYYILGFLIGGWICLNQQIITGKTLMPGHWQGYINKIFLIIALFVSLKNFKENNVIKKIIKHTFIKRLVIALTLCALIFLGFNQQNNYFNLHKPFYLQKQSLYPVFTWLLENTDKNDVVLTDPFNFMMSGDLPEPLDILVYSHNFYFLALTCNTLRSQEELEDRHLVSLAILGYNQDEARDFITFHNGLHFLLMGAVEEYGGKGINKEYVAHLENKYKLLQQREKLFSTLKKYRLDYILLRNKMAIERGLLYKEGVLSKVYDDNKFVIFKLNQTKPN